MNTMFIEDNKKIIKAGLKRRSQFGNVLPKSSSSNNQDIIKQTLDMFQSIKRSNSKKRSGSNNEEEKHYLSDSQYSSENEVEQDDNENITYAVQDGHCDDFPKDDLHEVWDNTDLILNGIFDLDELNMFQLFKLRSQTYPSKKQILLSNQKIILNFQNVCQLMSDMRKKRRQRLNNGVIYSCASSASPSRYEYSNDDWKNFSNDKLHIHSDISQSDSYKQFQQYYNHYITSERNKMRSIKFNRYDELSQGQIYNSKAYQSKQQRAAEILKRKFLMEQNNDTNIEQESQQNVIQQCDNQSNIECADNNNFVFVRNMSMPQEKLPKNFQIRKFSSIKVSGSELSQNSSPNIKSSNQFVPQSNTTMSSQGLNILAFQSLNGVKRIRSIDFTNTQKINTQRKLIPSLFDNNQSNNFKNNKSGVHSLNNIDSTDYEEETEKSISPLKIQFFRNQSQGNMSTLRNLKETEQQSIESFGQPLSHRENIPQKKQIQNSMLTASSLRLSLDCAIKQKLLFQNTSTQAEQQISPQKMIVLQQNNESVKNSPMKNSQFNYFSFKNYQVPHQQIGGQFLQKISTFNTNLPDIQKVSLHNIPIKSGKNQRLDVRLNENKYQISSKSVAQQVFLFDNKDFQNESPKKYNSVQN